MGNQSSCFHEGQGPCGENNSGEPASQLCQFGVKSEESCKEQKSECEIVNSLSCIEGFEVFVNNYGIGKIIKIKQEKDHHYIEIMYSYGRLMTIPIQLEDISPKKIVIVNVTLLQNLNDN